MDGQPGEEQEPDDEPGPGSGTPGPAPDSAPGSASRSAPGSASARDARLAGFARGGRWDTCPPSAALATVLEGVSGPDWRCPGATRDELFGLLRRAAALESWAVSAKLGLLRALIREEDPALPGERRHGDLPDQWSRSLTHEVSAALAMPPQSADRLIGLAWDLAALLPGIGRLLANGTLTYSKAIAVTEALDPLSERDKARAEAMILPRLAGKTYGQAEKLAVQAAITVDPDSAARRRENAERNGAKVSLRRGSSGAANLSGYDLPTDQTLAAHAQVCVRATEYKTSGAFPDVRMDQLRAQAYLDLLNGISADARITAGQPDAGLCAPPLPGTDDPDPDTPGPDGPDPDGPDPDGPVPDSPDPDSPDPDSLDPDSLDPDASGTAGPDGGGPAAGLTSPPLPPAPRLADLVLPLATLLGLARRPGEGHALGPLDPDLCRSLAATAVNSAHSTLCVTVADEHGYAIGHGCARPTGPSRNGRGAGVLPLLGRTGSGPPAALAALPARVNLTVTSAFLAILVTPPQSVPPVTTVAPVASGSPGAWSFAPAAGQGPPGGYGAWELTLPDGRVLVVELEPVPTFDCDHRRESRAYRPSDALRHLVQIRDYECTFPTCSRHARESDFEHAVPYHRGGKTCGCNAGARSRQCHQVKQSPGWKVTQPRPGWHQWETPSGRVYRQEPKRYPV